MFIDTHAHLYWDDFKPDLDEVIKRALRAGIDTIINIGVDTETSQVAASTTGDRPIFYSSIGIHPHEAVKFSHSPDELIASEIQKLEAIYSGYNGTVVLVGECGLDFKFDGPSSYQSNSPVTAGQNKQLQIKLLQAHINLAKKLDLPLTIHCRDAWDEIFPFLAGTRGILHCYSGEPHHTELAKRSDYLVSFAGNITYPKNNCLREAVKALPLEKIVVETDCPFLSPQSKRGDRNEPGNIKEIAECVAQLKGISLEELGRQTSDNVKGLLKFGR